MITLDCNKTETILEYLEISIENAESQFIELSAEIQRPFVSLNHHVLDLGKIFAGINQTIDSGSQHCLVLKNYGNLPALFHWQEEAEPDHIVAYFEPARGTIPPKSEVVIRFNYTVYTGGMLNHVFICDIQDNEFALGF
jgi:hypothetical protein